MKATMLQIVCILLTFLIPLLASASEPTKRNLYSGGMLFFQPGYLIADNPYQKISERGNGLGGMLRLYFGRNLTAGIYGSTHKATYSTKGSVNSTLNIGYGGPFIGWTRKHNRYRFTLAVFVGRGALRNLHINSQQGNSLADADLYHIPLWLLSPMISADFSLTPKLVATLQFVCPTTQYNKQPLYAPTIQVGVLFNR
jgi:hypothetical protein